MIAFLLLLQAQAAPLRSPTWFVRVNSSDTASIVGFGRGWPLTVLGAELSLHSVRKPPPGSWATVMGGMPADSMGNRLVTLTGDLSTSDVVESAVLWLRVDDRNEESLAFKNSSDQPMIGTGAKTITVSLRTNTQAASITYGLMLRGSGRVDVRRLRIYSAPVPSGPPAPEVRKLLDYVYSVVSARAYWRDTVTWSVVKPEYWALAEGARTTDQAYPAIQFLLLRLGDHHSQVMPPSAVKGITASPSATTPQTAPAETRALGGIGYVMVPTVASIDSSTAFKFAMSLRGGLASVAPSASCGWVLDLRGNGGGNMWPMLAGLKPLLGSGVLGYFRDTSGDNTTPWRAGLGYPEASGSLASLYAAPVAVLTGPLTASSGEAVAIAFRGRPRTRSFGLATAGLANANTSIALTDGGMLNLMTAVDVDRDGHVYGYKVDPDVIVPDGAPGTDPALDLAIQWLKAESKCK